VRPFEPALAARLLGQADLVLDGLLGTGASGAPRGAAAAAIHAATGSAAPVVAVDIPSGVDGSTGAVPGEAVTAAVTVTFQAAKPGHVLPPGSERTGRLVVADIGLPLPGEPPAWGISEAADLAGLVPLPRHETHKRSRGVLLAIGGASGMGGAPLLMGLGARGGGFGLLVLATPASIAGAYAAALPEALTAPLPEADGGITPDAVGACKRWLDEATAVAVGPGLGRSAGTREAVRQLLAAYDGPMVIDADGLFALGTGEPLLERKAPTLITPHAGEFARLAPDAGGTRLRQALEGARRWGVTVLLKGDNTVIAAPDGRLAVNPTGVPALATGGTGDVLTGLCGTLLSQGLRPFDAARLAAWVHGRAAQLEETERRISYLSLQASLTTDQPPPRLLVWPEVPAPFYYYADSHFRDLVTGLARLARSWTVIGTVAHTPRGEPLNSAVVLAPSGEPAGRYDKIHLVPFGEFVPKYFSFINKITPEAGNFQPGASLKVFRTEAGIVGLFICYEAAFPHFVRRFAAEGAEVLVNISNDGYFGRTAARDQHLKIARMRAAENRRWLLRATNDGITTAIDPAGRLTDRLPPFREAALRTHFSWVRDRTPYTRYGDWFAWLCAAGGLLTLLPALTEHLRALRLRPGVPRLSRGG
jgi:hydroxyethylthiazole kinase-like uncharacterized protein yjeF